MNHYPTLTKAIQATEWIMENCGELVRTTKWQAQELSKEDPTTQMVEVLFHSFSAPMPHGTTHLNLQTQANQPWAEDHFMERVCGYPLNPGKTWEYWPWASKAEDSLDENGMFNHNYMERYWPKKSGFINSPTTSPEIKLELSYFHNRSGIRGKYGDLNDVVTTLSHEPDTRQAYLPIWFPEDTASSNKGRKPCTLGYHFIMRDNLLHLRYDIRSCDLYRHFRDDIYLTIRLAQWVLEQCRTLNPDVWSRVELGNFHMNITSLHMFYNDYLVMFKHKPGE